MSTRLFTTLAVLTVIAASDAHAQERRRSPDGAGPGAPLPNAPTYARVPFAGAWQGMRRMDKGPGTEGMPYVLVVESDSLGKKLSAYVVLPNGEKVPVLRLAEASGILSWQQPNSGGGTWHYTAHLVGRERMEGTLILKDWPQGGGETPTGSFSLVRRPSA